MKKINLHLSASQYDFIKSNAVITVIIGPQGEGKTFAGFVSLLYHIQRQPKGRILRGCIVRDTFENIRRMTIPSIREAADVCGVIPHFSNGGKQLEIPGGEFQLFGMDSIGALGKIQGAEYGFIWLEEPAPILDKGNSGLPEEVFDVSLTRVARQTNSVPRLQITMNPADEDHWTFHKFIDDPINLLDQPLTHSDIPDITTQIFDIPYGENPFVSDISRQSVKAGYKDRPDLFARYVEGKFSFLIHGAKVTPEYNPDLHRSIVRLDPIKGVPVIRGWDGGLYPTCVFIQQTPSGRLIVLDTLRGENIGLKQFITSKVKPLISTTRYHITTEWRDIGDPAISNAEQSNSNMSGQRIIEEELNTHFEPGPVHWVPRRESLRQIFSWMIDGVPMFQISCHEGILHRALRGGWHYKKDNSGIILRDKAIKDIHSHPGDCLSYVIGTLLPWKKKKERSPETEQRRKLRARGYAVRRL